MTYEKYADGSGVWALRVGPFKSRAEAAEYMQRHGICPECGGSVAHTSCDPKDRAEEPAKAAHS